MRKHYATKLKEDNKQLLSDLYAIIDGNIEVELKYKIIRKLNSDIEKIVWMGDSNNNRTNK